MKETIEINLPASKSISNRLLLIQYFNPAIEIENLSDSQDTQILKQILTEINNQSVFDVGMAGTTFRFLTALFSITEGERTLTGSERMKQRPISPLVDVLRKLGAEIHYLEKEGFPPLKITGKKLSGGLIKIDSTISSQFISALILIAPYLKNGLSIILKGNPVSMPYIDMTLKLMRKAGAKIERINQQINVFESNYKKKSFYVESDWSSASYWYELMAISDMNFNIKFNNLFRKSIQPDSICAEVFQQIGVSTQFNKKEAIIQKEGVCPFQFIEVNCIDFPDLAQTLAVTFSILKTNFLLKGLQTLNIKETNRILALKQELLKIGVNLQVTEDKISSQAFESLLIQDESLIFNTYHDHRMAMAFAPLSLIYDNVTIENPQVVGKSYPNFWREFEKIKNTTL